ncbi:zinc finger protein 43-like [Neocloeon triangulifer]|uniref:zinc finger protein 43-like n=1 Tax=Neocloeon triangulifer TaxID=2078957 RepID=UPI00286F1450|nr:zinc finger protein 43-like [Neocloeon triangulifer]
MSDICKGCGELQCEAAENVLFHAFPDDDEKRLLWEQRCIEINNDFDANSHELVDGQNWTVCSRHFKKDDYISINNDIHILKPNAIPSVFMSRRTMTQVAFKTPEVLQPQLASLPENFKILTPVTGTRKQSLAVGQKCQIKVTHISEKDKLIYKPFNHVADAHNWKSRCRLCAKVWSASFLFNLFGDKANDLNLVERINTFLPVKVDLSDHLPLKVCKHCIQKIETFHDFREQCRATQSEFNDEATRFALVKALEAQDELSKQAAAQEEASTSVEISVQEGTSQIEPPRKRGRKSNPARDVPTKRVKIFRKASQPKTRKNEAASEDDDLEFTVEETGPIKIEKEIEEPVNKGAAQPSGGIRRFNLRIAPKPNVILANMGFPTMLMKTQRSPAQPKPSILRQKLNKSPELKELQPPKLPKELQELRKRDVRQRGLRPRNKRYFMTRKQYGDRIINQKCDSKNCKVVCDTVHKFLQHKYLYHDESNFSFCKVCSQVYETKPRNVDNGHRHLPEQHKSLPVLTLLHNDSLPHPSSYCHECDKEFPDRSRLLQHNKSWHGNYHCSECGKIFPVLYEFKKHIQDHIFTKGGLPHRITKKKGKNKFTCEICKESMDNFLQLNIHTMKNHDQHFKFLPCDCCNSVFFTEQLLRLHKELQASGEVQLCENCGSFFATATELRAHKKVCLTITTKHMACKHCNLFIHPNKMKTHLTWHITRREPERCKKCLLPRWSAAKHNCKLYRCDACQLSFNGYPTFLTHKRTHVGKDARYFCNVCTDATFVSFEDLAAHFKDHTPYELKQSRLNYIANMTQHRICPEPQCLEVLHRNVVRKHKNNKHSKKVPPNLTKDEVLTCPTCNEVQPGISEYIEHRLDHDTVYELPCSHCDLTFDSETRRNIHITRSHNEASRVTCDMCLKVFNSMQKLRVHVMRHLKYKPYVCRQPNCKASYYTFGDWKKHSMLHLGMNPNYCKACNKQFMKPETLVAHNKKWHPEAVVVDTTKTEEDLADADVIYQCSKCSFRDRSEAVVIEHLERDHLKEEEEDCEKVLLELGGEGEW